ncbi:MAG: hypothetical protein DMG97_29605 [Acidobacteria bacterium]|nr:MAG: hypothetical protein DMG97_29605 [Acidobacteriota bacterium]
MKHEIYLRCHARILDEKPEQRRGARKTLPRPKYVLVLDTETTTDARQTLNFGAYQFCEADSNGEFVCRMNILLTAAIAFGTVIKAFWQCRHRAIMRPFDGSLLNIAKTSLDNRWLLLAPDSGWPS